MFFSKKQIILFLTICLTVLLIYGCVFFFRQKNYKVENGKIMLFRIQEISEDIIRVMSDDIYLTNLLLSKQDIQQKAKEGVKIVLNDCRKINERLDKKKAQKIIILKNENESIVIIYYDNRQEIRTI